MMDLVKLSSCIPAGLDNDFLIRSVVAWVTKKL